MDQAEKDERIKQAMQLDKMKEQYNMDNYRDDLRDDVQNAAEEARHANSSQTRQVDEVMALVHEMIAQH